MKRLFTIGGVAMCLALNLFCSAGVANANATLTPTSALKAQGITSRHFQMVSISPNNKYICGYIREYAKSGPKRFVNTMYILSVNPDGSIGKARAYPLEGVARVEQACFTPDSNAVVFTTKAGATFMKLDCDTGKLTTIMEHKRGTPGFRSYPEVIIYSNGEMLAQGYYYDANDFSGRNAIAVLDPDKTGVGAFTLANELQKAQFTVRREGKFFTENFPRKDTGFITSHGDGTCLFYEWTDEDGLKKYDTGKELHGAWGGDTRLLYTVKRLNDTYDLCVYDAKTDKKVTLSEGRRTPFLYVFLSSDGKTAIFNDTTEKSAYTTVYYARESEGWKVKPIKGLNKKVAIGSMRISADGSKMILHNNDGIRVVDIEGE